MQLVRGNEIVSDREDSVKPLASTDARAKVIDST